MQINTIGLDSTESIWSFSIKENYLINWLLLLKILSAKEDMLIEKYVN